MISPRATLIRIAFSFIRPGAPSVYKAATMVPFRRRLPHSISPLEEAGFEPSVPRGAIKVSRGDDPIREAVSPFLSRLCRRKLAAGLARAIASHIAGDSRPPFRDPEPAVIRRVRVGGREGIVNDIIAA